MAAVLNAFGYDWTTNPDQTGDSYANTANSITIYSDFVSVGYVTAQGLDSLIDVGTTVSYDRYISGGDYTSWSRSGHLDPGGVALDFYQEYTGDWVQDAAHFPDGTYNSSLGWVAADNATGIHFDYYYDSTTTYVVTITDILTSAVLASGSANIEVDYAGTNIDSIDGWLFSNYVSNNVVTIENFAITPVPEPMTMALLGLGGLLIRRRKR